MDESQISSFVMWSIVTGVLMVITGLSYGVFIKKKKNKISSSEKTDF